MPNIVPKQTVADAAAATTDDGSTTAEVAVAPTTPNPASKRYHSILRDFMGYTNSESYPEGHTFTDTELSELSPDNIIRFFTFKLYGDGDVNPSEKLLSGSHHTIGKL